ncbi:hypothetical protein NDJ00_20175 [Vibrio parahaemolyticus]|nr:hypothetical protein [Vibrio parahaemolyticus]MCS0116497.1 hypothetical protein [Vibrio parahaemolyticus]
MKKLKPNINYGEFHKIRNSGGLYVLALVGAGEFFLKSRHFFKRELKVI